MSNDAKTVVLIADDEPSTLALLGRHLRSRGYSVLEAADGDEAWELAHEHLPDLVILDVMMPGMSGWEVCRKVREAVSLAHTGVIMLTGIGETLNEMTSPLYGADAHVDKPFEFAVLDGKLADVLQRRRAGALGRPDTGSDDVGLALSRAQVRPVAKAKPAPAPKAAPQAKPVAKAKPAPAPKPAPAAKPKKTAKAPPQAKKPEKPAKPKKAAKKAAPPAPRKAKKAKKAKKTKRSDKSPKGKPKLNKKESKAKPRPPRTKKKAKARAKPKAKKRAPKRR